MARSSRRYPSPHQSSSEVSQVSCDPAGMPRARSLLLCIVAAVVVAMVLRMNLSDDSAAEPENLTPAADLTKARVRDLFQGNKIKTKLFWCPLASYANIHIKTNCCYSKSQYNFFFFNFRYNTDISALNICQCISIQNQYAKDDA